MGSIVHTEMVPWRQKKKKNSTEGSNTPVMTHIKVINIPSVSEKYEEYVYQIWTLYLLG